MDNMTNRRLLMLLLAAGLSFGLAACGEDDDPFAPTEPMGTTCTADADCSDNFACNIAEGAEEGICYEACTSATQCAEGFDCAVIEHDGEEGEETDAEPMMACVEILESSEPPAPFRYIAVVSNYTLESGDRTPGPDIAAIQIIRGNDTTNASAVEAAEDGALGDNPTSNHREPELLLGSPTSVFLADGTCNLQDSAEWYFLGADGGFVAVSFGDEFEIRDGDQVRVWELAQTFPENEVGCSNITSTRLDQYSVFVGTEVAAPGDPSWVSVGTSPDFGGVQTFTISLPAAE